MFRRPNSTPTARASHLTCFLTNEEKAPWTVTDSLVNVFNMLLFDHTNQVKDQMLPQQVQFVLVYQVRLNC